MATAAARSRGAGEKVGIGVLMRLGAHDVCDPQPLLVLVLDLDDAQHHDAAADADRPAAGIVHRAVPFRGIVNDNQTFWLVTRLVASSPGGHARPDAAPNRRMLPRRGHPLQGHARRHSAVRCVKLWRALSPCGRNRRCTWSPSWAPRPW